jgi:molybdenum cofactor cytidylyltransferase
MAYAGLILAAGYSSRMREMKALLPFGGETLVVRQINCFISAGISDIYIVVGHKAEEITKAVGSLPVNIVYNENYPGGMFASIQAGVRAVNNDIYTPSSLTACQGPRTMGVFLLPVDYALAQPFTIEVLKDRFEKGNAKILYPCFKDRKGHPPLFTSELIDEILSSPLDGGLKGVFERHKEEAEYVDMGNETCLIDIDSKQDYYKALDYLETHIAPDFEECDYIYRHYNVSEKVRAHCAKVAGIAQTIAKALMEKGYDVDPELVFSSGLLHDIKKGERGHALKAAQALSSMGYPKAAALIANHMDLSAEYARRICNESILYFADKVTGQTDIVDIRQRMSQLTNKYGEGERMRRASERLNTAMDIQHMIQAALGEDVMRLIMQAE